LRSGTVDGDDEGKTLSTRYTQGDKARAHKRLPAAPGSVCRARRRWRSHVAGGLSRSTSVVSCRQAGRQAGRAVVVPYRELSAAPARKGVRAVRNSNPSSGELHPLAMSSRGRCWGKTSAPATRRPMSSALISARGPCSSPPHIHMCQRVDPAHPAQVGRWHRLDRLHHLSDLAHHRPLRVSATSVAQARRSAARCRRRLPPTTQRAGDQRRDPTGRHPSGGWVRGGSNSRSSQTTYIPGGRCGAGCCLPLRRRHGISLIRTNRRNR